MSRLPPPPATTTPPSATPISTPAPTPDRRRSRLRHGASLLGLAVSLAAVAGVVYWAVHQQPPRLPDTRGELLAALAAVALYGVATLIRGERWQRLLVADGARPRRVDSYSLTVVGYMGNNLLPARAGDALRVLLLAPRAGTGRRTVVGTLLAERVLDVVVILVLFVVVGYGLLGMVGTSRLVYVVAGVTAVAALAVGAVAVARRSRRLHALVDPILSSTLGLRNRHGAWQLAATGAIWGIETAVWMSVGAAVGLHMGVLEGVYLVALASVFALIPSGPGYAGTQDAAAVIGIKAIGGTGSMAISYLLMLRFVIVVPITVCGLAVVAVRYGGLRRLRAAARAGAAA